MSRKFNCVTHALNIEGRIDQAPRDLDWRKTPLEALKELAGQYDLQVRPIDKTFRQELYPGEWKICFFGWVPIRWDRADDNRVILCDYHLVRQESDGSWTHRETWGADPQVADLPNLIAEYRSAGYEPRYFAVRRSGT